MGFSRVSLLEVPEICSTHTSQEQPGYVSAYTRLDYWDTLMGLDIPNLLSYQVPPIAGFFS